MVIGKIALATGKWINGKWVKTTTETITETVAKGRWINGKWVKEAAQPLENGRVYTKMKTTSPVTREVAHTRLPEGMLPEEMTIADIRHLFNARYTTMRYGKFPKKINPSTKSEFYSTVKSNDRGMYLEETDEWLYRKPNWMTDSIVSFRIIPQERISMNVNPDPELIRVLDRYIASGEVVKDGKIIRTVTPPKAYYKSTDVLEAYEARQDPITMYFRESATKEQIIDIVEITKPFQAPSVARFPTGAVDGAHWLSHAKEHSPEDLYQLYKRAMDIDPKLGEAINRRVTIGNRVKGVDYGKDLPLIERFRFRISEGQYQAIESVVNDFEKALGKHGFDRTV